MEDANETPSLGTIDMLDKAGGQWELRFSPEAAVLTPPRGAGAPVSFSHEEFAAQATLFRGTENWTLTVRLPERAQMFTFQSDAGEPLRAWMRQRLDVHLAGSLTKRVRYGLPIATFIVATSVPIGPFMFVPLSFAIGVALLVLTALGRWRPSTWLFGFDAIIWLGFAANNLMPALTRASVWSIVMCVSSVFFAVQSYRELTFFRRLRRDPSR